MNLAAIFTALLLVMPGPMGRDAARRVSGSEWPQAASTPEKSPAEPAVDPAKVDEKPAEAKQEEETPPQKKAEESSSQGAPSSASATVRKRHSRTRKPAPPTGDGEPRKIVIHRGGVSEPVTQILPGISQEEADRQRASAEQLLAAAESSLRELATRSLNMRKQQTVVQIRQYVDVARSALKESDTQRAHTLALKAYLLSDDLVKH